MRRSLVNVATRAVAVRSTNVVRVAKQSASFSTIYDNHVPFEDLNRHRSDAELRIAQVPVVEVEGIVAVCDGGGGALGHPLEYIQLDTVKRHTPQTCKYCGIRYKMKEGYHADH